MSTMSTYTMAQSADEPRRATTQRRPHTTPDATMNYKNPLHCVRDYSHQQFHDAHRIADETVTFLQTFKLRLQRFEAQTGEFAQQNCHTTDVERPAETPTDNAAKPTHHNVTHATGDELPPRQRSPHITPSCISPPDTTTSEPRSTSLERLPANLEADTRQSTDEMQYNIPQSEDETIDITSMEVDQTPTPHHSPPPVLKSEYAMMATAPPVHPAQSLAQPLIVNVRSKREAEPEKGHAQPDLSSRHDDMATSESDPKYRRVAGGVERQTVDDNPSFNSVQDRPVFFPVNPEWFHLGSHCAPLARQVEFITRPANTYIGPFNNGTQTGGTQSTTEAIIRTVRVNPTEKLRADIEHTTARQIINENMGRGTIGRVDRTSTWCSPCSFVPIPNGDIRSVVDLIRLNKYTTRPILQSVESRGNDPNTERVHQRHVDEINQQDDPETTRCTYNTRHVVHKQKTHTTGPLTGLIPDRGKN